jgi:hypothetical protein
MAALSATSTALTTTGRIGVNTAAPTVDFEVNGLAKLGNVTIGANPLYAFTSHTFTNANATGRTGPSLSAVRSAYTNAGATWATSYLNMTSDNGIQLWTVPVTGNYIIRAVGAAGFIGPGLSNARGIDIQTTTTLIKGEVIKILVGQRGSWQGSYTYMGSGGGGSFVVRENSTPIIIAGGGGGTGGGGGSYVISDASKETDGMNGSGNIDSYGTNGGGGKGGQGSGGGGFLQGGFAGINNSIPPSSFLTGGVGGLATGGSGAGGFGGGGYAHDTSGFQTGGGGGGGYSGGGGGTDNQPGGGGGSFAISALTVNGYNTGHGYVTITLNSPSSDFDVAGVSRLSASSATATALTTVGRIGVNTAAPTADLDVTGVSRLSASSATATALTTTGRIGVNTATPTVDFEVNGLAKLGNANIVPLYVFTSHTFTNAGATGRLGPTLTNVTSAYSGVSWAQNNSYLSMTNDNGIQLWTVPLSGNYTIRAKGAAGLDTRGGKGRDIQLTTTLVKGEVIRILVGQQGTVAGNFSSGGGGTFVVRGTDTPIIVAGGGGGRGDVMVPFSDANIGTSGGNTPLGWYGGTNGGGGQAENGNSIGQPAGGGFNGNGVGFGGSSGGVSFTNGGFGGQGNINGGFGGGGGWFNTPGYGGAGGGGYSGGGGGGRIYNGVTTDNLGGGGGGSFGITTLTDYGATNTGHGGVTITLTTPSVALEVVGVAVVTGSSATSTALTTTGRIGVNTAAPTVALDVNGEGNILNGLTIGSSTNSIMQAPLAQKLSIYHDTNARIFLRYGTSEGMLIGNYSGGSFIGHREALGELEFYTEQNTPIVFRTNKNVSTANRLTILGDGKVGIGTTSPSATLDVNGEGNILTGLTIGSTTNSSTVGPLSQKLSIYHQTDARIHLMTGTTEGMLISNNSTNSSIAHLGTTGEFVLNCEQNRPMKFKTTNTDRMTILGDGKVGIGTTSPEAPLHVVPTVSHNMDNTSFFRGSDAETSRTATGFSYPISIRTGGDILINGGHLWVSSDKRIKKNIRDIQGATALSQVRKIRPKVYNHIDYTKGTQDIYGFIAQETEDVITTSSTIVKDYIPNFYCKADIVTIDQANHIYEISTENEFKFEKVLDASGNEVTDYKIKLYDDKNKDYICTVIHRIDAKTIHVKCDKEFIFSTIDEYKNTVFIYGQEVHDFYNLDKNSIFTVATAALQEVDRQQQADKARIAELEATVASHQSLIHDILERLNNNGL